MISAQFRHRNRTTPVALALVAAMVAAGCGANEDDQKAQSPKSSPPTPSPSVDPEEAEESKVLEAYEKLTAAESRTYAKAKQDPGLEKVAAHEALKNIRLTMLYHQDQGTVMKGDVSRSPEVRAINIDSSPPKAVVKDCADSSRYDEVDAQTGKVKPVSDKSRRHMVNSTAHRSKAGEWKFYTYAVERGRTC